jgi:CRISPR/Cas system CSM-associated protein Csm3 (group 7 of RAMP superfamily)
MTEPKYSPYNFVPLSEKEPVRARYPGLDRLSPGSYSGVLVCHLTAVTPLFSADHQRARPVAERDSRTLFPFLRNSSGVPILQATTLKGMVRAVYEAAFPSCLPLVAESGLSQKGRDKVPYKLTLRASHDHSACKDIDHLCPACRLFGIAQGDEVHAQGRAIFSDAVLSKENLLEEEVKLAELSSPKPHHYAIYSLAGKEEGEIRGRKLYIHHEPSEPPTLEAWSPRANAIKEFAPPGSQFSFKIRFDNLNREELTGIVSILVLDDQHGHKIGMAKPLGYGSCQITIQSQESFVESGEQRYQVLDRTKAPFSSSDWMLQESWLTGRLEEILRLSRPEAKPVGYLPFKSYQGKGIDEHGQYISVNQGARQQPTTTQPPKSTTGFLGLLQLSAPSEAKSFAPRKKATLEVVSYEAGIYTLRDPETGQENITFKGGGVRWEVGQRIKVRIVSTKKDGSINQIQPG